MNQETTMQFFTRPHVTITRDGFFQKHLPACRSPKEILAAFNEVEPRDSLQLRQCWYILKLRRGSFELRSLHDVRQAWHLWKQVMFLWTASKGLEVRKMRSGRRRRRKMMTTAGNGEQQVSGFERGFWSRGSASAERGSTTTLVVRSVRSIRGEPGEWLAIV